MLSFRVFAHGLIWIICNLKVYMENNMTMERWNGFSASVPGAGHIRHGITCQDASAVSLGEHPAVIVCDGRGSAKHSHFGAREAVAAFKRQTAILAPFISNILDNPASTEESWEKFSKIIFRTLMQVKLDLAAKYDCSEKEFDFTVALAIVGKEFVGCFQVGDGSLVVFDGDTASTVFEPEKGEFANQTHFLRLGGENTNQFQYKLLPAGSVSGVSATSDGPEHLMFELSTMTPGKIFNQMFSDLATNELCRQDLMDFLTRKEWNNDPRGADDRSIAIISRLNSLSENSVDSSTQNSGETQIISEDIDDATPVLLKTEQGKHADSSEQEQCDTSHQCCNLCAKTSSILPVVSLTMFLLSLIMFAQTAVVSKRWIDRVEQALVKCNEMNSSFVLQAESNVEEHVEHIGKSPAPELTETEVDALEVQNLVPLLANEPQSKDSAEQEGIEQNENPLDTVPMEQKPNIESSDIDMSQPTGDL